MYNLCLISLWMCFTKKNERFCSVNYEQIYWSSCKTFPRISLLKDKLQWKINLLKKYVLFIPVIFNRHVNLPKRNEHIKTRKTPIPNIKINLFNFNFSTEILDEDFIQAKLLKIWKIINIIIYAYYFYKIDVQKWTKI